MALNVKDCLRMSDAAKANNKSLLVVKQNRFNPPVGYAKQLIDGQKLGNIFSISMNCLWNRNSEYYLNSNWKGKRELDGGILFTQFSHFFDVACWLFGDAICIGAIGQNFAHNGITEFEDSVMTIMKFERGSIASMHFSINAYHNNMEGSLTILGEMGSLIIGGEYLNTLSYHKVMDVETPVLTSGSTFNDYGSYTGSMNNHHLVYEHFISSLENGHGLNSELEASISTIAAIESVNVALNKTL